jgi:hypothetical protein
MLVNANNHLSYIDEEFLVEITKTADNNDDLIIAISFTRTFTFSRPEVIKPNGHKKADQTNIQEINSSTN